MRLYRTSAAVLLGLATTASVADPVSAATSACAFPANPGAYVSPNSSVTSPGVYSASVLFPANAGCTPFPAKVHSESTLHVKLNGLAQPDTTAVRECTSPDPIAYCSPINVGGPRNLACNTVYTYELNVSMAGWYQETTDGPKITIAPVSGPPRTGTIPRPAACG